MTMPALSTTFSPVPSVVLVSFSLLFWNLFCPSVHFVYQATVQNLLLVFLCIILEPL